jgi:catechol 2,3-dioxygenase-like lactoylglutathione lyase family enzyme
MARMASTAGADATAPAAPAPPWGGVHHVALVTRDLDATARFYADVLGMAVRRLDPLGPLGRHCFVYSGPDPLRGLHFIEQPRAELGTHPEALEGPKPFVVAGAFQHLSFALPDQAAALALRGRLREHGRVVTEIVETGPVCNLMFADNNGILLEATWPKP